jgi:low density lipoprotein-related protein 2
LQIWTYSNGKASELLKQDLARPKSLQFFDSRLYYIDPLYEKLVRVDLPNTEEKLLKKNEPDLKAISIWRKQPTHICGTSTDCDQICIPAKNKGRRCGCGVGFQLTSETSCSPYKSFLVIAQGDRIRGISDDSTAEAMIPISSPDRNVIKLDYFYKTSTLFWIEFGKSTNNNGLFSIRTDGSGELKQVISKGIGSNGLRGLAIDWVHEQIYFTNAFPHETYLEICKLDGKYRKVLAKKQTDSPRELAVNPIKKLLYWIDYGQFPRIGRALLDGSNWTELVTSGITNPRDITIDYNNHDVYWTDSGLDTIQKVNWEGKNRVVVRKNLPNPVTLAVHNNLVFWGDKNLGSVYRVKIDSGQQQAADLVKTGLANLKSIKYFDEQVKVDSGSQGGCAECEQLCYPMKNKDVCDCATGRLLNNKCVGLEEFLVFSTRTEIRWGLTSLLILTQVW